MTVKEIAKIFEEVKSHFDKLFIQTSIELGENLEVSSPWVLFVYSDASQSEILGKIYTVVDPITAALTLAWEVKWYTCLSPVKGDYHPLYAHDCGYIDTLSIFLQRIEKKALRGEKQKEKDLRKKQILEE